MNLLQLFGIALALYMAAGVVLVLIGIATAQEAPEGEDL